MKVFDTLRVLVEHAGRLLTKEELLSAVWPDTVVEENNLNHTISILRKTLGEKATGQRYIETVPRVGYRFTAAVMVMVWFTKPSGSGSNSKSIRADNGSMFPPVTGTRHSFQMTPHSTCRAVWVRIRWWRRSQSTVPWTWSPTEGRASSASTVVRVWLRSCRFSTRQCHVPFAATCGE